MAKGSFGRRATVQPARRVSIAAQPAFAAPVQAVAFDAPVFELPLRETPDVSASDREFDDWKKARKYLIPWRQISWMASICFGVASFVLPDNVNGWVDWLLYGLAGVSFLAGFSRRSQKAKA